MNRLFEIKKVLISYAYAFDSEKSNNKILYLIEKLKDDGIIPNIDKHNKASDEGFQEWITKKIQEVDYVFIICTNKYNLIDDYKQAIINKKIYDENGKSKKFIPISISLDIDSIFVPTFLRNRTIYNLEINDDLEINNKDEYVKLINKLTGRHKMSKNSSSYLDENSSKKHEEEIPETPEINNQITYDAIEIYHKDNKKNVRDFLSRLEEEIIVGRDEEEIPIYLTKWRIKSIESMYLKTKRNHGKINKIQDITDFGGIRIICMFEQDILQVHKYLIGIVLKKLNYDLNTFKIYNWDDKKYANQLKDISKTILTNKSTFTLNNHIIVSILKVG